MVLRFNMEIYKETKFKETEIGRVPIDWKVENLKDISSKIGDGLHGTPFYDKKGKCFFVNGNNILNNKLNFNKNTKKVSFDEFKKYKKNINNRTLFVSINGTLGNIGEYKEEKIILGKSICYLNVNLNIHKKFINYVLKNISFQEYLLNRATGSTIKNVSLETMRKFCFSFPSVPTEQKNISKILSDLDEKIENNKKINENLEEIGKTIFKRWFVDFEFPDEKGKPYKSSGGKMKYSKELEKNIPEEWEIGKIGDLVKKKTISYRCDSKDLNKNGNTPILDQGESGVYGYTNREPDFLASEEKPILVFTNHTCNYWFIDFSFCAIQNVLPLKAKEGFNEYFLYFLIKNSVKFSEYKGHWPELEAKNFIIPTKYLRGEFTELVKKNFKIISKNLKENQKLQEIRDYLLPKLMKGEIRIKN